MQNGITAKYVTSESSTDGVLTQKQIVQIWIVTHLIKN